MTALNLSRQADLALPGRADPPGLRVAYRGGEMIFAQGEAARNVFIVVSGAVRAFRRLSDGRRQVVAFHLPGDVFGFDGAGEHDMTAQSMGETTLRIMRRATFFEIAPVCADGLDDRLGAGLKKRPEARVDGATLGHQSPFERLVAFLLDMRARMPGGEIALPMACEDIADYLGLPVEAVALGLAQLRGGGGVPGLARGDACTMPQAGVHRPVAARRRGPVRYRPAYRA